MILALLVAIGQLTAALGAVLVLALPIVLMYLTRPARPRGRHALRRTAP